MPTSADEVWPPLALGAVPAVGLLVGAIAGSLSRLPHYHIAMAMSVGAGLLFAGVSRKVAADAIRIGGPISAALSLLLAQPRSARPARFSHGAVPLHQVRAVRPVHHELGNAERCQCSTKKRAAIATNVVRHVSFSTHRHDSNTPPTLNLLDDGVDPCLLGSNTIVQ